MKNTPLLLFILTISLSCKAQNIIPIFDDTLGPAGSYYKDIDNDFNSFVGEWKWEEDNSSLTIVLNKFLFIAEGQSNWDIIAGEYRYIENGITRVDELPFIPDTNNLIDHNLWGGIISLQPQGAPPCDECQADSRFIKITIKDPTKPGRYGDLIMVHFNENGQEKIRIQLFNGAFLPIDDPTLENPGLLSIPEGIYTLIKQ